MKKRNLVKEMQSMLKMKLKYFRTFYEISLQQKKVVSQSDNDQSQKKTVRSINNSKIEALLQKKDNVIAKILELEEQIKSITKSNLPSESKLTNDSLIKSFNQQIKDVIDNIVLVEKEVETTLKKHNNLLKERFGAIRRGKTLVTGYGGQRVARPRFIDYKLQ
jgi:hypothetical protein|tara:strand:- start:378 stop:866 length:489 start_codon:yes stop_codon:yes gene_type:complete